VEELVVFIKQFGVAAGLLAFALFVLVTGRWVVLRRELDACREENTKRETELIARIALLRDEKDRWEGQCLRLYGVAAQATSATKESVKVAEKSIDIARNGGP
jgi:hypothetical protein